jgi:integrase/recombinase XerD
MATVDIHHYERKRDRAAKALEVSKLSEGDRALVKRFVNYKKAEKVGLERQEKYLRILRIIGDRFLREDESYSSLRKEDVVRIVSEIEGTKWKDWTKHDFRLMLKTFLKWLGKTEEVAWVKTTKPKKLPDDLLSEQDVQAMIDATVNLRDKALIAMLYEGGFRIGELGSMQMKDITFDRWGAIAIVNGKTGMRRVRLIWSMPYIAQWMEAHPQKQRRDAPLWVKMQGDRGGMDYQAIRMQLQKTADRAGVQKRVNPHNFRHSRSTHLASRLTESQMEEYLGWVQGSRMPSIYVHMSGRDLDADLLQMYGLQAETAKAAPLEMLQCPYCKTVNTRGARVCMTCKRPIGLDEVMSREAWMMNIFKGFVDLIELNPDMKDQFKKLL